MAEKEADFTDDVVKDAWLRAAGVTDDQWTEYAACECERKSHGHEGRCRARLWWYAHNSRGADMAWEAHHTHTQEADGPDTKSNCEIICWPCHKKTF